MKLDMDMFDDAIVTQIACDTETNQSIYVQFTPRTGKHWVVYVHEGRRDLCVGLQDAICKWNHDT